MIKHGLWILFTLIFLIYNTFNKDKFLIRLCSKRFHEGGDEIPYDRFFMSLILYLVFWIVWSNIY